MEELIKTVDDTFTSPNYPQTVDHENVRLYANEMIGYIAQLLMILRRTGAPSKNQKAPCSAKRYGLWHGYPITNDSGS